MTRKIPERESLFDISIGKYFLQNEVFLIHSKFIEPTIQKDFMDSKKNYTEKDGIITFSIPIASQDENEPYKSPEEARFEWFTSFLPKWDDDLRRDFYFYKNFTTNLEYNPHFYRYFIKQTREVKWLKEHRSELAYLLLLDVLSETPPTIFEANQEFETDHKTEDRTRQRRSLRNEYYPGLFFKPKEIITRKKSTNKNIKKYSTILTEVPKFGKEYMWDFQLMMTLNQEYSSQMPPDQVSQWWGIQNTCIKLVSVEEIRDILNFSEELNKILKRVKLRVKNIHGYRKEIVEEIENKTNFIIQFRTLLNFAVYIRWFDQKTPNEKRKLLTKQRRIKYTLEEAQKAVSLLLKYYKNPKLVSKYLTLGEQAFTNIKKHKEANILKKERKKLERTSPNPQR